MMWAVDDGPASAEPDPPVSSAAVATGMNAEPMAPGAAPQIAASFGP